MNRIRTLVGTEAIRYFTKTLKRYTVHITHAIDGSCCLVADTAYSCDPRIKKFKEEEKARKESEKKAKAEAKKREQEEKERVSLSHNHSISTY